MKKLPSKKLEDLKRMITKQFPDLKDIEPKIETKEIVPKVSIMAKLGINMKRTPVRKQQVHIATFGTQVNTDTGAPVQKVVRATLDADGNIIRISHSK